MGLTGLGFLFLMLGVLFLFDRGLLAMGNVRAGQPLLRPAAACCLPPCSTRCSHQAAVLLSLAAGSALLACPSVGYSCCHSSKHRFFTACIATAAASA